MCIRDSNIQDKNERFENANEMTRNNLNKVTELYNLNREYEDVYKRQVYEGWFKY